MNLITLNERLSTVSASNRSHAALVSETHPGMALEWLDSLEPQVRCNTVVLTHNPCPEYAADLWDTGVGGLVVGAHSDTLIEHLIERVNHGERIRQGGLMASELIPSERAILRFLPRGDCNKRIASRLGLSERTVRNRLVDVAEKLSLANRTQIAMYYAGQWQWLAHYRGLLERFEANPEGHSVMGPLPKTVFLGEGNTVWDARFWPRNRLAELEPVALASD
jgi:DNA-binding CsgD family transcriptional regulator